jgi:hypothetical protein
LPSVETSMIPTARCTCAASAAASPYECGRRHSPVHIMRAPACSWRRCSGVRRVGSYARPASAPSGTGAQGGRAVVVPIAASSVFVACA